MGPAGRGAEPVRARAGPRPECAGQDLHVLAGRDEPVLDLLAPQPTPAGTFEPMAVGGLRETAFHQVTTPAVIAPGCRTGGLRPGPQHKIVQAVPGKMASGGRAGAVRAQRTGRTHPLAGHILGGLPPLMIAARIERLAGRAGITVRLLVVRKIFLRVPSTRPRPAGDGLQVGPDAALLHPAVVVGGAVLLVPHHGGDRTASGLLVLVEQRLGLHGLGHIARRGHDGGDDAAAVIDGAVLFVPGTGIAGGPLLVLADTRSVGIRGAAETGVDRLIVRIAEVALQFALLDLVGELERGDQ